MRLVDANILVYAFTTSFPQHERAHAWLDGKLNDGVPLGLPWPSLLAFVRLTSNQRLFDRPVSVATAWRQVEEWLACESAWVPQPTPSHADSLSFPGSSTPTATGSPGGCRPCPARRPAIGQRFR